MTLPRNITRLLQVSGISLFLLSTTAMAANDPSIKGDLRTNIQQAMNELIQQRTVGDRFKFYDAITNKVHNLKLVELHDGIVKKGDFYVSCADFADSKGNTVDMDFMVIPSGNKMVATQAILHKIDGKKRKYHLED
ncbi:MAG: hypothetical protein GXP18_02610 [Gammaproteobacteria bacterium]|nr:hypothetical protein [Gammaproteobacteria bacterium]